MTEFKDKVEEIRKRVSRTSLHISRIPEKTKTEFIELAKADFAEDYGMCIKWLMDFRKGLLENPNSVLSDRIDVLADEMANIKEMVKEPEQEKMKMLSGKELNRRKK